MFGESLSMVRFFLLLTTGFRIYVKNGSSALTVIFMQFANKKK